MSRPLLLDLFCGAGGCAAGYHRAGFDVIGVDLKPQKNYPFEFIQGDALQYLATTDLSRFAAIHASPPCQAYSATRAMPNVRSDHPDLVGPVRDLLVKSGNHWVIENVIGAPLDPSSLMLCGLMFGLKVLRHRLFETSFAATAPRHPSHKGIRIGEGGFCTVAGHGGGTSGRFARRVVPLNHRSAASWRVAMGIDWMVRDELAQAIPPAYTEFVGKQLMAHLEGQNGR